MTSTPMPAPFSDAEQQAGLALFDSDPRLSWLYRTDTAEVIRINHALRQKLTLEQAKVLLAPLQETQHTYTLTWPQGRSEPYVLHIHPLEGTLPIELRTLQTSATLDPDLLSCLVGVPDAVATFGLDWRCQFMTPTITRFTSHAACDFIGQHIEDSPFPATINRDFLSAMQKAVASGVRQFMQFPLTKNQRLYQIDALISPMNRAGECRGVVVTFLDVSEQAEVHAALSRIEQRFSSMVDQMRDIFWIAERDMSKFHYISPAFERLFGYPAQMIYDHPEQLENIYHPDDRHHLAAKKHRLGQGLSDARLFRVVCQNGQTMHVRSRIFPGYDEHGHPVIYGISEDDTERRELELALERHHLAERDTLVREIHHRIKNTLQGVAGLLQHHARVRPELAEPLHLAISRLYAVSAVYGLQARNKEWPTLGEMLDAICAQAATDPQVNIGRDWMPSAAAQQIVEREAVPISLVINELMVNAIKHRHPVDSPVHVALRQQDDGVVLQISNFNAASPSFPPSRLSGVGTELMRALLPVQGAKLEAFCEEGDNPPQSRRYHTILNLYSPVLASHNHHKKGDQDE